MSTQPRPYLTPKQYLAIERSAEYRSEYFDGEMFARSGGSLNHATVKDNLAGYLFAQLRGSSCRHNTSDVRVLPHPDGPYFYPDIVIYCGKPQLEDANADTLIDATVIVEVLSPSTERYDRTFKFEHYREMPSLTDYLLIAQDRVHVERKTRNGDQWDAWGTTDPDAIVDLRSIGCNFRVADVYANVEFPPVR